MPNCAFCDKEQLFEERIIHATEHFYIVAALGQITDGGYVLLVPKDHFLCMAELPLALWDEALTLGDRISEALRVEYMGGGKNIPTQFEHGIVGQTVQHAHLHFLPAALDLSTYMRAKFTPAEIDLLQNPARLREVYLRNPEPYLYWTTQSEEGIVGWNPPVPLQCLRTASAELMGRPERANWRKMDKELDRRLWEETVRRLMPYFNLAR